MNAAAMVFLGEEMCSVRSQLRSLLRDLVQIFVRRISELTEVDSENRADLGIVHSFCRSAESGAVDITDFTCIALMVYTHAHIHT